MQPSNPGGASSDAILASLSVMSEAQQKELNRLQQEINENSRKIDEGEKTLQELRISVTKIETSRGSASELIKTVGVPLLVAAVTALVAFYLKGLG